MSERTFLWTDDDDDADDDDRSQTLGLLLQLGLQQVLQLGHLPDDGLWLGTRPPGVRGLLLQRRPHGQHGDGHR